MRNLHKQKEELQDYAMNASYTIHSLTFMEDNVKQNLVFEENTSNRFLSVHIQPIKSGKTLWYDRI